MFDTFKTQTDDAVEKINDIINTFEKIQRTLEPNQRDITKYDYKDLKSLIEKKTKEKEEKKEQDSIFSYFKKVSPTIDNETLNKAIKYFGEIKDNLSKKDSDFKNFNNFESFKQTIENNYFKIMVSKLLKMFPNLDENIIAADVNFFVEHLFEIPLETKSLLSLKPYKSGDEGISEFETFFDNLSNNLGFKDKGFTPDDKYGDIRKIYDNDGLEVYVPTQKEQCIRLGAGKANWCISKQGGGNYYYHYRLGNKRTIYFVFDNRQTTLTREGRPNKWFVILVDPNGNTAFADADNRYYAGERNIPWDEIVSIVPRIENLKHLFVPRGFSEEENIMTSRIENIGRVTDSNLINYFSNMAREINKTPEDTVAIYMEYKTPELTDEQYINLTPDLMKKYINSGQKFTKRMLENSPQTVISYYFNKKIQHIIETPVSQLNDAEIFLLKLPKMKTVRMEKIKEIINSPEKSIDSLKTGELELLLFPEMKEIRESMREKFESRLPTNKPLDFKIIYPKDAISKMIKLYPDFDLFAYIPKDAISFDFQGDGSFTIDIPESIVEFENLFTVYFDNFIKSLPNSIGELPNLEFITLNNNQELTELPESLIALREQNPTMLIEIKNSPNLSEKAKKIAEKVEFKFEIK
jgi:uncharacterized protein (UPF0335 family)